MHTCNQLNYKFTEEVSLKTGRILTNMHAEGVYLNHVTSLCCCEGAIAELLDQFGAFVDKLSEVVFA